MIKGVLRDGIFYEESIFQLTFKEMNWDIIFWSLLEIIEFEKPKCVYLFFYKYVQPFQYLMKHILQTL